MKKVTVTMHDVARLAGVSQTTVSLILNQDQRTTFSQDTVNRVYAAAEQLNYKAKRPALQKPTSKTVMVLMANVNNPHYTAMLSKIEDACYANGINAISCCTYHDREVEKTYMELAVKLNCFGVIVLYPAGNQEALAELSEHLPVVTICDRTFDFSTDIVELNNFRAGQIAAEHLLSLGHRRIAVLTSSLERNIARTERLNGLKDYFAKYLPDDDMVLCVENGSESDKLAERLNDYHAGYFLARNENLYNRGITALVCMNDALAYGVLDALKEEGLSVPGDVSVIGFDNQFYSRLSGVALTTVDLHTEMLAGNAVNLLLQKIRTTPLASGVPEHSPRFKIDCEPGLVVRQTTTQPPDQGRMIRR